MTHMVPEEILDLSGIEDIEIPCDYSEYDWHTHGGARWVMYLVPCACGQGGGDTRLTCAPCKDLLMVTDGAAECPTCGAVVVPWRLIIKRIEPV